MLPSSAERNPPIVTTDLPLRVHTRGKVRDVYVLEPYLLIVATDRLSAYDHVLPTPIPDKGRVLTQLSAFWFQYARDVVEHHMVATDIEMIASLVPPVVRPELQALRGRVMLVRKAKRFDVECVVRGYLAGSAWEEYRSSGAVTGIVLPTGLTNGARLPDPIFTPATKATTGHDENISFDQMASLIGAPIASRIREVSIALYTRAATFARGRGLLLADTKFEFGLLDGSLILIDEALTPDSSRYWDAEAYPQELVAYDKQYVRDYLTRCGWDRASAPPALPADVVAATRARYLETYQRVSGRPLDNGSDEP